VIAVKSIYGPTVQFLRDYLVRFDVHTTFVEGTDPAEFAEAVQPNTRLIYLESPSSVVFKQQDLQAVAEIARAAGASTICDNSWASPIFQNPIEHGIDMVVHSATKYLGGHSDIVAGVVAGNKERLRALKFEEGCLLGAMLDPFASWLMLRGMRTLPIRMERFQKTTQQITRTLQEHPAVLKVLYPGLSDEPQPELTRKQLRGTTSLFSFALKNQTKEAAYQLVNSLELFGIGCSWGGFESLALPMSVSSRVLGENSDKTAWIVRCHLGLEGADELWDDLCHALTRISHLS
jgi:cystathionine beta-lyase/cystathionine gamma-synthase